MNTRTIAGLITLKLILSPGFAAAQSANPEHDEVMQTIHAWTYTMANGDIESRNALTIDGSMIHVMAEEDDGSFQLRPRQLIHANLSASDAVMIERYWNEQLIVNDQLATFWADYDFWIDGEFSHCGADIFNLAMISGVWKLGNMSYTVQRSNCSPSPLGSLEDSIPGQNLQLAESFIDAFYSFNPEALQPFFFTADASSASLMFYQGWAEGGNYKIVERQDCRAVSADSIVCPITVEDDPMLALGLDFKVTDTFTLTFDGPLLIAVETSSNDLPVYYQAFQWVTEQMPEVMEGPCQGYFAGGPTPQACARAMTEGYRQFAASEEFPRDR